MVIDDSKIPNETLFNDILLKPIRVGTINKGGQGERIYSDLGHAITLSAYGGGPGSKTGHSHSCPLKIVQILPKRECSLDGYNDVF